MSTQAMDKDQVKRRPVDTTRHHRENGWDYRGRAIYHFTLPVEARYPLFGVLEGESAEKAFVRLNPFGRQVCRMLSGLAQFYEKKGYALKVLTQMVMPDHVHLVIQVLEPLPQSIGAVVRGFKSACTKIYKEEYFCSGENAAKVHGEGNPRGENAAKVHGKGEKAPMHFTRIFAGRGQLRRMIDYVKDNPRRLWLKTRNPDLFRLHRHTEVNGLSFTSMGNHFLLDWPDRQAVEVSRSAVANQVEERLRTVLAAAHNGAVTYTAAISKGEQHIARALREQGYPMVVLLGDGFPKEGSPHERYYKPGGVYFEACSKGQLLLLEPTEQVFLDAGIQSAVQETLHRKAEARHLSYVPISATAQRYHFVALNEIANRLSIT